MPTRISRYSPNHARPVQSSGRIGQRGVDAGQRGCLDRVMDLPEQKFFVSDDGKEKLSITKDELQTGIDSGKYGEKTLAWTKGMGGWLPLSDPSWEKHGVVMEQQPPPLPPSFSNNAHNYIEPTERENAGLTRCPDCGSDFSKRANACPKCGGPNELVATIISESKPLQTEIEQKKIHPIIQTTEVKPDLKQRNKQRHGCLTAYLIFMIIVNCITSISYLSYFFLSEKIKNLSGLPIWMVCVMVIVGIFNVSCCIAIFRWRMWGFWGFVCSAAMVFFFNLYMGIGIISSLSGLLGIAFLFGVLQIGQDRKGWSQLE